MGEYFVLLPLRQRRRADTRSSLAHLQGRSETQSPG